MTVIHRLVPVLALCVLTSGCISTGNWGKGQWPDGERLGRAAKEAALDPHAWVPVVAAGVLLAADVDHDWSEDLAEDQPLFGDDAEDVSDDLRDVATASYVLTALLAPSETFGDKARGLAVGAGTMIADGVLNRGLKEAVGRERPDGSNDNSLPSGHASKAASRTNMAIANLQHIDMPDWSRHSATWLLRGVAFGTGLARVEAEKHHLSDVLLGYAFGNFVANFMRHAFLAEDSDTQVAFQPLPDGGALTLTIPLRR